MKDRWIFFFALTLIPLTGISIDIYSPSLPSIQSQLNTTLFKTQFTIVIFLITYGVFQILWGVLSDAWGRRRLAIIALTAFLIASFSVYFVKSINALIIIRTIQGVALAGTGALVRAALSETRSGKPLAIALTYVSIAFTISPFIAPFIGGYLEKYFGWRSSFYLLGGYSILLLILMVYRFAETHNNRSTLNGKKIYGNIAHILSSMTFISCICIVGLSYMTLTTFNVVGPYLIQNTLGFGPEEYGIMALIAGMGWFVGNVFNRFCLIYFSIRQIQVTCATCMLLFSVAYIIISNEATFSVWSMIPPIFFIFWLNGMFFPNIMTRALSLFTEKAGTASGLIGFGIGLAGLGTLIGRGITDNSDKLLALTYLVIAVCIVFFYFVFIFPKHYASDEKR